MCSPLAVLETSASQWRAILILSASQLRPCVRPWKTPNLRAPKLPLRLLRPSWRVKPRWPPDHAALYQLQGLFAYLLPLSCRLSSRRAAHGHAVQLQRGDANAHRHRLSIFTAGANAFIELKIVAHHGNFCQRVRTVANQRAVLQRRGYMAVFNHVSLRRGEDKLAVGNVHLSAAKVHRVNAALY